MPGTWGKTPFALLLPCLVIGLSTTSLLRYYSFLGLVLANAILLHAGWLSLRRNRPRISLGASLGAMTLSGFLLALANRDSFSAHSIRSLLARGALPLDQVVFFDGCLVEEAEKREEELLLTVELHGFRAKETWTRCEGKALLRLPVGAGGEMPTGGASPRYGDRLHGWAEWNVPRNFQNPGSSDRAGFLARRGIYLVGRIKSLRLLEVLPRDCANPWKYAMAAVRERLRNKLGSLENNGARRQAAVLASLLIGDQTGLDAATREAFQSAGTYHVLVVSGLHVGWIAWILTRALRFLRLSPRTINLLVAGGILFYASLVGFQASVTRCLWVYIFYLTAQALFRTANSANLLLAAAFVLLVARPDWLADVGFQLSFLSVLAIFLLGTRILDHILYPLFDPLRHAGMSEKVYLKQGVWHYRGRRLRAQAEITAEACADRWHVTSERLLLPAFRTSAGLSLYLGGMASISFSVQVLLGPIMAFYFNRLSWISPVANLFVVPLASLVLGAGALSQLVVTGIPGSSALIEMAGWGSALLLRVNEWLASLPWASERCPTPSPLHAGCGLFLILAWCLFGWRRVWIPCAAVVLSLFWLANGFDPLEKFPSLDFLAIFSGQNRARGIFPGELQLTFLDVGQGDSIVIRYPNGSVWVLDAGGVRDSSPDDTQPPSFDTGEAIVSRYLWHLRIRKLDRILLSHPHQDHAGGLPALMKNFATTRLDYGEAGRDPTLVKLLAMARERRVFTCPVRAGEEHFVGSVRVQVLNPLQDGTPRTVNDNSIVLRLSYGRFAAMLTGDLEAAGELEVATRTPAFHTQLLKVAHHGSRTATQEFFLNRARPRWAVISAGRNNPFGHPSREVLLRLIRLGARPFLTTDQGAITFVTDGNRYSLSSHVSGILEQGILPKE